MAYQASNNGGDPTRGSNYYNPSQSASMRDSGNSSENQMSQDERNTKNNANNIRNAADVAIASKNPYAMAAGAAFKGLSAMDQALGINVNTINKKEAKFADISKGERILNNVLGFLPGT